MIKQKKEIRTGHFFSHIKKHEPRNGSFSKEKLANETDCMPRTVSVYISNKLINI